MLIIAKSRYYTKSYSKLWTTLRYVYDTMSDWKYCIYIHSLIIFNLSSFDINFLIVLTITNEQKRYLTVDWLMFTTMSIVFLPFYTKNYENLKNVFKKMRNIVYKEIQKYLFNIMNFSTIQIRNFFKDISLNKYKTFLFGFSYHSRIFHSYGDVTITSEGLQILNYARHSWLLSSEGSLACHT